MYIHDKIIMLIGVVYEGAVCTFQTNVFLLRFFSGIRICYQLEVINVKWVLLFLIVIGIYVIINPSVLTDIGYLIQYTYYLFK